MLDELANADEGAVLAYRIVALPYNQPRKRRTAANDQREATAHTTRERERAQGPDEHVSMCCVVACGVCAWCGVLVAFCWVLWPGRE